MALYKASGIIIIIIIKEKVRRRGAPLQKL